jgi:succinate dehydrogenase / fumarate reductase cytochrome b subunit
MAKRDKPLVRPLSPYMQYVNAQSFHTMGLSILHRITGIALSVGAILLVYWLIAAASGPDQYSKAQALFASVWIQVLLIGWIFSFCYHFLNGIRHLVWDTGRGFDLKVSRNSGYAVLIAALISAALLYFLFVVHMGGST